MTIEHVETAIIGAGQAGLATAYHLQRRGRSCLILDSNDKLGDNWRAQWDSLRLYSPAQYDGLPGLPFPSPRWSFPTNDQVAGYLGIEIAPGARVEVPPVLKQSDAGSSDWAERYAQSKGLAPFHKF